MSGDPTRSAHLCKLRWLLKEQPADPPSPIQFEPLDGEIAQDADHSTETVKIEPGLNDFDFPQDLLDEGIPECSHRAMDITEDLQRYHQYHSSEYQNGTIGNFHPPEEFKEFDEENLWGFSMSNPLDLSPPFPCPVANAQRLSTPRAPTAVPAMGDIFGAVSPPPRDRQRHALA